MLIINLVSQWFFIEVKMLLINKSVESILKGYKYCKKIMKKNFNKNLIMTKEEKFQSSNMYLICEKLIEELKS